MEIGVNSMDVRIFLFLGDGGIFVDDGSISAFMHGRISRTGAFP